jgi:hypothetical protein
MIVLRDDRKGDEAMAEAIILEFAGLDVEDYNRVNEVLGIDPRSGQGDWPEGLLSHTGAATADGWVVFEIWDSKASQEGFMEGRLGRALKEGGVEDPPSRMEWLELAAHHNPGA